MYIIRLTQLIDDLQHKRISLTQGLSYFALFVFFTALGLSTCTVGPVIYFLMITLIQEYLKKELGPIPLTIVAYDDSYIFFWYANIILLLIGVIWLYLTYRHSIHEYITATGPLLWTINMRLIVWISILLLCIMGIAIAYFGYKFVLLAQQTDPRSFLPKPLDFLLNITVAYPVVKTLLTKAHNLVIAQNIFNDINTFSYYLYWTTQATSTIATLWLLGATKQKLTLLSIPE
jgi:hypothetical protein